MHTTNNQNRNPRVRRLAQTISHVRIAANMSCLVWCHVSFMGCVQIAGDQLGIFISAQWVFSSKYWKQRFFRGNRYWRALREELHEMGLVLKRKDEWRERCVEIKSFVEIWHIVTGSKWATFKCDDPFMIDDAIWCALLISGLMRDHCARCRSNIDEAATNPNMNRSFLGLFPTTKQLKYHLVIEWNAVGRPADSVQECRNDSVTPKDVRAPDFGSLVLWCVSSAKHFH